ncbi:MAG: IS110 family transposase [Tannerella sp.]|nr:IS110 family transposase [Tannerella sp.]
MEHGIKVCLVHPREARQVKGRRSDVKDAHRIQKLFAAGLLRGSIVAEGKLRELRFLTRERMDLIDMGATSGRKKFRPHFRVPRMTTRLDGGSPLRGNVATNR